MSVWYKAACWQRSLPKCCPCHCCLLLQTAHTLSRLTCCRILGPCIAASLLAGTQLWSCLLLHTAPTHCRCLSADTKLSPAPASCPCSLQPPGLQVPSSFHACCCMLVLLTAGPLCAGTKLSPAPAPCPCSLQPTCTQVPISIMPAAACSACSLQPLYVQVPSPAGRRLP